MSEERTRYTLDRAVRLVLSAVVLAAVLALLRYLSDVLLPFAAAVVLAYLLNPLVTALERRTKRRGLAVAVTIGGLGILGLALLVLVVPLMIGQVGRFRADLEKLRNDLAISIRADEPSAEATTDASTAKSETGWRELQSAWAQYRKDAGVLPRSERLAQLRAAVAGTYIGDFVDSAVEYTKSDEFRALLLNAAKRVAMGGWGIVTFALNLILGLTGLIIVLVYLVFLLADFPQYARTWPMFLPPAYREAIVEFLAQFNLALRRYLRGQSVVALLTGAMLALGFSIIGLPMAVPFGLFVGLLTMVPYLQAVALVPAVMLAGLRAIEGDSSFLGSVVFTLLVFGVVQVVQDGFITPRVMGQATGLRPVAILLGVFIWGKLLGFIGLLLAIPLTCLGIAYYRRYVLLHPPETTHPVAEPTPARAV